MPVDPFADLQQKVTSVSISQATGQTRVAPNAIELRPVLGFACISA
jgi:hypothetical protein